MAISALSSLAAKAPVPIYPVIGPSMEEAVRSLRLDARLEWVNSPRHARVLLVAGGITPDFTTALRRLHAQLPSPRSTLWWCCPPLPELATNAYQTNRIEEVPDLAQALYREQWQQPDRGEPELCPDEPPAPWKGLGDHGQGGEGMMGGTPYGRPMAMTDDDLRDGLALDPLTFSIGPFWPILPPGLSAKVTLHGDVVAAFDVMTPPYPMRLPELFQRALYEAVPIAEIETARANALLHRLSHALWVNGFDAASRFVLRKAQHLKPGDRLTGLKRWLTWSGFFASAGAGKGALTIEQAEMIGGPAARAAGFAKDERQSEPGYRDLGFTVLTGTGGGCEARWRQWLVEAEQSLALAEGALKRDARTANRGRIETSRGTISQDIPLADASSVLTELLPGLEWSEAMAVIASLDLAAVGNLHKEDV